MWLKMKGEDKRMTKNEFGLLPSYRSSSGNISMVGTSEEEVDISVVGTPERWDISVVGTSEQWDISVVGTSERWDISEVGTASASGYSRSNGFCSRILISTSTLKTFSPIDCDAASRAPRVTRPCCPA